MTLRWSRGSQGSELECPSQAAALLVLVLQWHCRGTLGISTAWPRLKERIPSQMFKTNALTFLLTTCFVNKPLKGEGWCFPCWLVLGAEFGVGWILAILPSPSCLWIYLAIIHGVCLAWKEARQQMNDPSQRALKVIYRAWICSQIFPCLHHLLPCTV